MKLYNKELQWIFDSVDRFKEAVVALDFAKECGAGCDDLTRKKADEQVHDLAFSFLMVAMGGNIPKTLWSVRDYSELYGVIDDADLDMSDDG